MIQKIQEDTHGAVASMEAGTEEVQKGVSLANGAGDSLRQNSRSCARSNRNDFQIATASQEQSAAAEEISSNVEAVATITRDSTNNINETASTTESLTKLSHELNDIVGQFKL